MLTDEERQTMQNKNCLAMVQTGILSGLVVADFRAQCGDPLEEILCLCVVVGFFRFILLSVAYHNRAADMSVPVGVAWLVSLAPLLMLPAMWFFPDGMGMAALTVFLFDLLLAGTVVRRWPVEPFSQSTSNSEQELAVAVSTAGESA